jgi:hypothetical protein
MLNLQSVDLGDNANDPNSSGSGDMTGDNESVSTNQSNSSVNRRSGTTGTSAGAGQNSRQIVNWSGLQFHAKSSIERSLKPFDHLKDVILLDTGSTLKATFKNPDMVTNVKVSTTPVEMTTNSGSKMLGLEATVPGHGQVWFDPDQVANIYGFSHMVDKHRITYDSDIEDAFLVHTSEGVTRFKRTHDGLYAYRPSEKYKAQLAESNKTIRQHGGCDCSRKHHGLYPTTVREGKAGATTMSYCRMPYYN